MLPVPYLNSFYGFTYSVSKIVIDYLFSQLYPRLLSFLPFTQSTRVRKKLKGNGGIYARISIFCPTAGSVIGACWFAACPDSWIILVISLPWVSAVSRLLLSKDICTCCFSCS